MAEPSNESASVTNFPPIPDTGLATVLASWTGRGSLFEALSAPSGEDEDRQWTSSDVRIRANRILLSLLEPSLVRWPSRTKEWLDYLPASRERIRITRSVPFSGVSWAESRRRFGWPPTSFTGKEAKRGGDMLAVQVLRWCTDRLAQIWSDVSQSQADPQFKATDQVITAVKLLGLPPLSTASPGIPARADLVALRREGSPWGSVAEVAQILLEAERSIDFLLYKMLLPDDEVRWRLFHLSVLGVLLHALHESGCRVTSFRPLSPQSGGPNYEVVSPRGDNYLLWFEASGVWAHLNKSSPFTEATRGVRNSRRSNGADIMLLLPSHRALILECKYSWNQDFVARNGYYQAMSYGAEARSRLADIVVAAAVGPEPVVPESSFTNVNVGKVGVVPPSALPSLVTEFIK